MIARYSDVRTQALPPEQRVEVQFTLHNDSKEVWSDESGDAVGYQILDASNGNLIVEGPRTPYPQTVEPGAEVDVRLGVDLPPEPGKYQVYVSALREGVAWLYAKGAPFLLIEAQVADGQVHLQPPSTTTMGWLRLARLVRAVGRAFVYPVRTIVRHHSLIRSMVRRDIVGRYRGSYGGLFWTVLHPLLMMLTYYFVFGVVLQTRFGVDDRPSNFPLYFLAGMLPWLALSEAVGRAPSVVVEHSNFVRKLVFPVETLPVSLVFAGLFGEVFGVGVFTAGLLFFGRELPITALYLPLILIPQILLTLGLSWFLAALGVFFRDLGQVIGFLLTLWFFTTPICYPETALPQSYLWLFEKNPMYVLVQSYRSIFLENSAPPWEPLAVIAVASAAVFIAGHAWFYKLKNSFADLV